MTLVLKFSIFFAIVGLVISIIFGFVGGNPVDSIVFTAIVCTMLSAGLGVGIYKILEKNVPEFLEIFSSMGEFESDGGEFESDDENSSSSIDDASSYENTEEESVAAPQVEDKNFGDHIIVGDIQLKNEPKLMAAAIQTLLAKDDDGES